MFFRPSVAQMEVAHYKKVMQRYGVPLDSRTHLTKTDWSFWSASLADNQADFEAIISPIYDYLNATTARSPFVDSYETDDVHSDGMHARPVIGGVFIKMLTDRAVWKKWASRGQNQSRQLGAAAGKPPKVTGVVPTAQTAPANWRYTTQKPAANWTTPDFDASAWKEGPASFGTDGTPGAMVHTVWNTDDIWLRRDVTLPAETFSNLQFSRTTTKTWRFMSTVFWPRRKAASPPAMCRWTSVRLRWRCSRPARRSRWPCIATRPKADKTLTSAW